MTPRLPEKPPRRHQIGPKGVWSRGQIQFRWDTEFELDSLLKNCRNKTQNESTTSPRRPQDAARATPNLLKTASLCLTLTCIVLYCFALRCFALICLPDSGKAALLRYLQEEPKAFNSQFTRIGFDFSYTEHLIKKRTFPIKQRAQPKHQAARTSGAHLRI